MTHVAVGIVGFRNQDDIRRCLEALDASTHTAFEVVICENGGAEAHQALVNTLPRALAGGQRVTILSAPRNLGFAGGVNVCLAASPDADAWWVLNPDTEPHPQALAFKVERLARGDCDAVGCVLHGRDGRVQADGGLWQGWLARTVALGVGRHVDDPVDAGSVEKTQNFLMGAAMLISRRFLDAMGPMTEDYFLYCEEVDWCLRAIDKGMTLGFAPAARVLHAQGSTTGAVRALHARSRMSVYLGERNKMLLTRELSPLQLVVAAPSALGQLALRYGARRAWRQFGWGLSGWWAGLMGERGPPAWVQV